MAKGRHSRGRHSLSRGSRREFEFPRGPQDSQETEEVGVPAEIAKTAAGKMQTLGSSHDERPEGEAATGASLDEWVESQAPSREQESVRRLEKKAKLLIAGIIAVALVAVGAIFLVESYRPSATPSQAVASALDALGEGDFEALGELYDGDSGELESTIDDLFAQGAGLDGEAVLEKELNDEQKKVLARLRGELEDFDYTVDSESLDGDAASVQVTIAAHDFGSFAQSVFGTYIADGLAAASKGDLESDADAATRFVGELDAHMGELGGKDRSAQTTFSLVRSEGGSWKLSKLTQDNLDALTGGLYSTTSGLAAQPNADSAQQ